MPARRRAADGVILAPAGAATQSEEAPGRMVGGHSSRTCPGEPSAALARGRRAGRREAQGFGSVCAVRSPPAAARGARQVSRTAEHAAAWARVVASAERYSPFLPESYLDFVPQPTRRLEASHSLWVANWASRVALPRNPFPLPADLFGS